MLCDGDETENDDDLDDQKYILKKQLKHVK